MKGNKYMKNEIKKVKKVKKEKPISVDHANNQLNNFFFRGK
jgi:hypothetical protein